jgi:hypothetical protein
MSKILIGAMAVAMATLIAVEPVRAQAPDEQTACTVTEGAIDACAASGGKFNTLTCTCETGPKPTPQPCVVSCPDGRIDPATCSCVTD